MPLHLRWLSVILVCLWTSAAAWAQRPTAPLNLLEAGRPRFRAIGVKEGLPNSSIMAITLDREGLLWVGTQDGAACYDGRSWSRVDMPDHRAGNYIHHVLAAEDGSLWFARQEGGVARLKEGQWTLWSTGEGLPADRVHSLLETRDSAGRPLLWAATYGGGLARWDGTRWSKVDVELPSRKLWKLAPVPNEPEAIWVGGEDGTVAKVSPTGLQVLPGLPKVSVNQVLQRTTPEGTVEVWASTYGAGAARYAKGRWTLFGQAQGIPDTFCTDLALSVSQRGERVLWVTSHGGLAFLEPGATRFQAYTFRSGLPTETLYRLYIQQPAEGPYTLWVGSSGAGLLALREGGWRTHDAYSGLAGSVAWCLAEVRQAGQTRLVAASGRGLSAFNGKTWEVWPIPSALQGLRINALLTHPLPTGDSELWVGALGALAHYRQGRWRVYGPRDGLTLPAVSAVARTEDAQGPRIWAGTTRGLMRLEGDRWVSVGGDSEFRDAVVDILLDGGVKEGSSVLWIGTRGHGVWRYHKGKVTRFGRDSGVLPSNLVTHLLLVNGPRGRPELWVATNGGGVAILDPENPSTGARVLSTATQGGLPTNAIQALAATNDGSVWLATNLGVVRVAPRHPMAPDEISLRTFTEDDGLPSANGNPHAILVDGGGRIWVGTRGGIGMLDPARLPEDGSRAPIRLRRVTVDGQVVPGAERATGFQLQPSKHRIALTYALLSFHGELSIRYQTQLVGLEEAPTGWVSTREREFVGLRPGAYRLKVWARDDRGPIPTPLEFPFQVLPSFWQRPLVQLGFGILLIGAIVGGLRTRERLHQARSARLEAEVADRTSALTVLNADLQRQIQERQVAERVKDEFISVVSHELRTPLTAIRGSLGLMESPTGVLPEEQRRTLLDMARRNSERLLHLVNDLLDMKRIESGGMELTLKPLNLRQLLTEAVAVNSPYAMGMGISLALEAEGLPDLVLGDPVRVSQVLANLLSNATKFCRKGGTVRLGALAEGGRVRIWIHNPGDPIPEGFRGRIFQKFAQAESGTTRDVKGTGLGLAITKALVEAMQGAIGFETGEGGTTFWFTLPRA